MEIDDLDTGDLILFHGENCVFSEVVEHFTHSRWSHCGIVVRDPNFASPPLTGMYLWESGIEPTSNPEEDRRTLGVQFTELKQKIDGYTGKIACRRLQAHKIHTQELERAHSIVHDKPYNIWIPDWLRMIVPWMQKPRATDRRFWCSALVGRVWEAVGILPQNTDWSQLTPGSLANISAQAPYMLGNVEPIKS
jgi:cell wall-associated NlpC family hydrolase